MNYIQHMKPGDSSPEYRGDVVLLGLKLPVLPTLWKIMTNSLSEEEKDAIRTNLTKLEPYSYEMPIKRFINTGLKGKYDLNYIRYYANNGLMAQFLPYRRALWSKALYDKDTGYKFEDYYKESQYKPTLGSLDKKYYTLKKGLHNYEDLMHFLLDLGDYTIGKGQDASGKYYSIYDEWDINPFGQKTKNYGDLLLSIELYDRIYENNTSLYNFLENRYNLNLNLKTSNGNTVDVTENVRRSKYSTGGPIKIKKKNLGSFTRYCNGKVTEECIRKGKNSSNPTTRKRANFAWVARHKFKHEEGGKLNYLNYFN